MEQEIKMVNVPVESPVTEFLHNKAAYLKIPINGTFELTPLCNMDCKMCYVHLSKEEQEKRGRLHTAEEWIELGKRARDAGMLFLLLTGGEPFLRKDFQKIYTELHKMGFVISINSNGTLIDETVMEWLAKIPPVRINMTLYGASNETYARLCGNPKGFDQAMRAIHLLKEAGINVKLNGSVTPYNVADLEAMVAFAKEENLILQATTYMFPPLRKDESMIGMNDRFSPIEASYYSAVLEKLLNGEERFLERYKNNEFSGLPSDVGEDCGDLEGTGVLCRAGKCSFWITWDGKMMPCGMLPPPTEGNVFEDDFLTCWEKAKAVIEGIRLPAKCAACPIKESCRACAAMVFTETGSFSEVPAYRCEMARYYEPSMKKVYEEISSKNV